MPSSPDSLRVTIEQPAAPAGPRGIDGAPLAPNYANSSALSALLVGTLVLTAFNAAALRRTIRSYRSELWSIRRRPNVFDDDSSASLPMAALLAVVFIVFGGVVLYNIGGTPADPSFAGAAASMALLGGYYIFQYCAYRLVGYTFGSLTDMHRWLEGFAAAHAFTGLALIIPALLLVYTPYWHNALIIFSLSVYALAKAVFIAKGFRIFYRGFSSLLYFILYLCTLEIIPLLTVYRFAAIIHAGF